MTDLAALRLHVRYDEGEGPLFVLLHGINADAEDWRAVIDRIGPDYRCLAVDLLGFGESPKPTDIEYTADEHALVLDATLNDLGITEQFVLVGYSLGGDIAIRYAAQHPERLRRLFLLSTPFYLPATEYARAKFGTQFFEGMVSRRLWAAVASQKKREGAVYELASGRLEPFAKAFLRTDDVPTHWDIMSKNLTNTIAAATFVDDLPHLSMPTVFALGVRDPIVRPDQTLALKRLKPDIEIRRIAGLTADHFMLLNLSERVADELLRDEVRALHVAYHGGRGRTGGAPVVLLHGIEDSSRRWLPAARAIAVGSEVATIDLLGFGASPAPLSSHYTLADHAAAVLNTLRDRFGTRPVCLVGYGLGAVVAIECAAERPAAVERVVAFSPPLLAPGEPTLSSVGERSFDPTTAAVLASRDTFRAMAADERSTRISSERLERRAVPSLRSLDALLATDAVALLARVKVPVRFVAPTQDARTPREWLRALVSRRAATATLVEPTGGLELPFEQPLDGVAAIGGATQAQLYAASKARPAARDRDRSLADLLGGANAQLLRRGALMLAGGLLLLGLPVRIPVSLVATSLAAWLFVESVQVLSGAVALKRSGKSWRIWLLIGLVSVTFAGMLVFRDAFAARVFGFLIAGWAFLRGVANLVVARRAPDSPGRRSALVLEGLLGVGLAAAILLAPEIGGRLLRWTAGGYLTASGLISFAFAYSTHRVTAQRIRSYVDNG